MPTSGLGAAGSPWRITNPKELVGWAFAVTTTTAEGVAVLEFVRDRVLRDPDFGEVIDAHTRGEQALGSQVEVIWTFNPAQRTVEIITPFASES